MTIWTISVAWRASAVFKTTLCLLDASPTPNFRSSTTLAMLFIMCSREDRTKRGILAEGFGIALVEASASGKPVIAGRSGGVADAVQDGITGLLVNPVDTEEVAAAIIKVLRESGVAREMGDNGRQWVENEMNWTRAADEFQQAMEQFFPRNLSDVKEAG